MPSKTDSRNAEPAASNFDDLDNYFMDGDVDDDPFASPKPEDNSKSNKRKEPGDGLGIDEEVSVAKKARVPRIKLDQDRYVHTQLWLPRSYEFHANNQADYFQKRAFLHSKSEQGN